MFPKAKEGKNGSKTPHASTRPDSLTTLRRPNNWRKNRLAHGSISPHKKINLLDQRRSWKAPSCGRVHGRTPAAPARQKRPDELWSGKQIFSLFLPAGFNFVAKSSMVTQEDGSSVVVKDGMLIEGVIDKNTIGAERSETLFHRIVKDSGSEPGRNFLNGLIKLLDRFITLRGFSYGINELDISPAVRDKITKAVKKAEEHVQELIEQYKKKTLERLPGRTLQESLELRIMDELSKGTRPSRRAGRTVPQD